MLTMDLAIKLLGGEKEDQRRKLGWELHTWP